MGQIRRRQFVIAAGAVLAAPFARAQAQARVPTVGALYPNPSRYQVQGREERSTDAFARYLAEFGWNVGKNVLIEDASAEGDGARLPALATALVAKKVDVIWAAGSEAVAAAARATTRIPIVFYGVGLPVEQGFADSLARPGRNITGLAAAAGSEILKQLELLREAVPKATRLAYLRAESSLETLSGKTLFVDSGARILEPAAEKLGFDLRIHPIQRPEDFEPAFAAIVADRAQVLAVQFTAIMFRERRRIADFALRHGLPSVHGAGEMVDAGGLLHYGASRSWMIKHSWTYVDRILRGANPAELPVELPSRFEVVVNLKTAKTLGLPIPTSIMVRADRLIE